jgi:hypothetical protein
MKWRFAGFSLRALLLGVTALCCFLAYEMNWIHQRRLFISEQAAKVENNEGMLAHWKGVSSQNNISKPDEGAFRQSPSLLAWFGETGYHHIAIVVPKGDTVNRRLGVGIDTLDVWDTQPDYVRAQRLFPEATIYPFVLIGNEAYEVNVKDALTGEVTTGTVYWGSPPVGEHKEGL